MASPAQIAANRLNSQKSTGPKSPATLVITRFNALKSGIDAKSQVIPGEDPAEFETLAENYRRQFQPATPAEVCLVDALTTADWELRRLRKIVPVIWDERAFERPDSQEAKRLDRLTRRLDAAERSYYRALKELNKFAAARAALEAQQAPTQGEAQTEAAIAVAANPKLASFRNTVCPTPENLDLSLPHTAPNHSEPALSPAQEGVNE